MFPIYQRCFQVNFYQKRDIFEGKITFNKDNTADFKGYKYCKVT